MQCHLGGGDIPGETPSGKRRGGMLQQNTPLVDEVFQLFIPKTYPASILSLIYAYSKMTDQSNTFTDEEDSCNHPERARLGSTHAEELSTRVDEYLSVTKLGREAFVDGDLQLAKDRFSLSMNIELNTDLECVCDSTVGRATGELKQELQVRCGLLQTLAGVERKKRYSRVLSNLEQVFLKADERTSKSPSDPKPYLQMASALIVVNEWEKAKQVYADGIACCQDDCEELRRGLDRLNKIESLGMLFQQMGPSEIKKKPRRKRPFFRKHRPASEMFMDSRGTLPRSNSFDMPDGLKQIQSPPPSPLLSPLSTRKMSNISAIASPMAHRKRSPSIPKFLTMRRKHSNLPNNIIDKRNSFNSVGSWSLEDISAIGRDEDRKDWRTIFNPDVCSSSLDDGLSTPSVQHMRMLGTMDSDMFQRTQLLHHTTHDQDEVGVAHSIIHHARDSTGSDAGSAESVNMMQPIATH